jgi:hypothetical protein
MSKGVKTLKTFSHQLHCWLQGEEILIGEISKMDTPSYMFSNGTHLHSSEEVTKNYY